MGRRRRRRSKEEEEEETETEKEESLLPKAMREIEDEVYKRGKSVFSGRDKDTARRNAMILAKLRIRPSDEKERQELAEKCLRKKNVRDVEKEHESLALSYQMREWAEAHLDVEGSGSLKTSSQQRGLVIIIANFKSRLKWTVEEEPDAFSNRKLLSWIRAIWEQKRKRREGKSKGDLQWEKEKKDREREGERKKREYKRQNNEFKRHERQNKKGKHF